MRHSSILLTAAVLSLATSAAQGQTSEPSWRPDEETVRSIEATLTRLPSTPPWTPGPLESYARYYKGQIMNGNRIVYGDWYRGRLAKEKPGIYLRDSPSYLFGGGCDHINMWYDIDARRMIQIDCYGLG